MNKKHRSSDHSPSLETSWDTVSDWYNEHLGGDDTYHQKVLLPNILRLINPKPGTHVLDIACGQGFFVKYLLNAGAKVTGVDISPDLIEKAKMNAPKAHFIVSPAHNLSFLQNGSVDHALTTLAIQNIHNADMVFTEVARVLTIGGTFTIVINHPAFRIPKKSSWEYDKKTGVQYRRVDLYLSEFHESIKMHPGKKNSPSTISFHRPLQWYVKHLTKHGLLIDRLEEWTGHRTSVGKHAKAENIARKEFPLFLALRLIKIGM
jgi:ubiquinone/menaquinone biosynthesis C-methylase UbiE